MIGLKYLKNYQSTYTDKYLMSMTKKELVEQNRIMEHNIDVLQEQSDNQYKLLMKVYFKGEGGDSSD